MSRATEEAFDALHCLTIESLISQINAYKNGEIKSGDTVLPVPPALLAQAIKLLKDNGIDSPARAKKLDEALPPDLPSFDEVVDAHQGVH